MRPADTEYRQANTAVGDDLSGSFIETLPARPGAPQRRPRPFGRYELLELISRGGLGDVYRARPAGGGGEVAVKLLRGGEDAGVAERRSFQRELETAGRLCHPGILPIIDAGEHD